MFLFYLGMSLYQIDDGFFLSLKPELSQISTKTFKGHLRPSLCKCSMERSCLGSFKFPRHRVGVNTESHVHGRCTPRADGGCRKAGKVGLLTTETVPLTRRRTPTPADEENEFRQRRCQAPSRLTDTVLESWG